MHSGILISVKESFMKRKPTKIAGDIRRKSKAPPARLRIQNILATTDLSSESIAGVRYAVALAEKMRAAVTLLHVVELPPPRANAGNACCPAQPLQF